MYPINVQRSRAPSLCARAVMIASLVACAPAPDARLPASAPSSPQAMETIQFCARQIPLDQTELVCTRRDVEDLAPLRTRKQLELLVLTFAPVEDLKALSQLSNLKTLVVLFSSVSDLAPIAKLPRLEALERATLLSPISLRSPTHRGSWSSTSMERE